MAMNPSIAAAAARRLPVCYAYAFDPDRFDREGRTQGMATILSDDGVWRYARTPMFDFVYRMEDFDPHGRTPHSFGAMRRTVRNLKAPVLPIGALATTFEFYREASPSEAQMTYYLAPEGWKVPDDPGIAWWGGRIFSYVPVQYNTGADSVTLDPIYRRLIDECTVVAETHSHDTMPAFMSRTDRENSDFPALQIVFGHVNGPVPEFEAWLAHDSRCICETLDRAEAAAFIEMPPNVPPPSADDEDDGDDGDGPDGIFARPVWDRGTERPVTARFDADELLGHSVFGKYRDEWMGRIAGCDPWSGTPFDAPEGR